MTATSPERPSAHDLVMTYRPLSQLLGMLVSKEVQKRLDDGRIVAGSLPLHIQTVRLVTGKDGYSGSGDVNDGFDPARDGSILAATAVAAATL